jgi:hypothetical protein
MSLIAFGVGVYADVGKRLGHRRQKAVNGLVHE